jgi:phytoene dehydrogenase-like protein
MSRRRSADADADAIVVGGGPNGLVAANVLADAGWHVLVVEGAVAPGGAVRTASVTAPGYLSDLYSAFYPLAAAGPAPIARLGLEDFGLEWAHAPEVVAHPMLDGNAPILSRDLDRTLASLRSRSRSEADGWEQVVGTWRELSPTLLPALIGPRPAIRPTVELLGRARVRGLVAHARTLVLSARRMAEEAGCGPAGSLLLGGNALHGDVLLESPGSGILGLLLCGLGHDVGFPVPRGGAERLIDALVRRFRLKGGELRCCAAVEQVTIVDGKATGVRLSSGEHLTARHAVIAAVTAPVVDRLVPLGWRRPADATRFEPSLGTIKIDWALSGPIPWSDRTVGRAGTVHVAPTLDELSVQAHQLARGVVPDKPFVIVGQMTTSDPSRSPAGTESAWAYTHLPARFRQDADEELTGDYGASDVDYLAARIESRIESVAPGFTSRLLARHIAGPRELERANPSLFGGDIAGGTVQLYQQGPFRPPGSLGAPTTLVRRLYVGSSSVHPGGGVHGGPGARAARAALRHARRSRFAGRP